MTQPSSAEGVEGGVTAHREGGGADVDVPAERLPAGPVGGPVLPRERKAIPKNLDLHGRHRRIDPRVVPGRFWKRRRAVAYGLIAFFVLAPHLEMYGKQLILLDVVHRRFTVFGATLRATDTQVLLFFLLTVFVGVFLVTALVGRAWCGWACPQPIYLEFVFRPLERWIEGRGAARRRSRWRSALKWTLFAALSSLLANTFLAYFVGRDELLRWVTQPPWVHPVGFFVVAFTAGLMLFDFGWFREQMCTMACPYARFQSVLLDPASLVVGYDRRRGEPRGRSKPGPAPEGLGDCIDCAACVRACPTGIDIRDGLQLECIACTQCIDACDAIMDRVKRPRGLIRYATDAELRDGSRPRILRARVLAYAALFAVLLGALVYTVRSRGTYDVTVLRPPGPPYVVGLDGTVANVLRVKVTNRLESPRRFEVVVAEPAGLTVSSPETKLAVPAERARELTLVVTAPRERFSGGRLPIVLRVLPLEADPDTGTREPRLVPYELDGPSGGGR